MRAWVLLLLAGCATSSDVAPGFEVRLVARGPFALGRPMVLDLEATNRNARVLTFDAQRFGHSPYRVTREGRALAYVDPRAGGIGTMQHFVSLQPGETRVLNTIDVAAQFAVLEPGDYVAEFVGIEIWGKNWKEGAHEGPEDAVLTEVPPSPPLRFSVGAGELSAKDQALRALLPALPGGWILYRDGDGLTFQKNRVDGSELLAIVEARFVEGRLQLSPLRLRGKSERKPSDDGIEAELRRTNPIPGVVAKALP